MKNGEIVYVVCMTPCTPDGGWPCAAFATKKEALAECERLAKIAKVNQERSWREFTTKKERKMVTFSVEKTTIGVKKKEPGFGVRKDDKEMKWDCDIFVKIYYVEEYKLGKKADRIWEVF